MKNYVVVLQLAVESYDKHGNLETPNTQHSLRRIYASQPCSEKDIEDTVKKVAALAGCECDKMTIEGKPEDAPKEESKPL